MEVGQGALEGVGVSPPDASFWTGKRVFVTGHTGFKGSWLALWLRHLGASVFGYSLAPASEPNLFTLADVARGIESCIGDVRDFGTLRDALSSAAPDVVFHLAAQPLVRQSYRDPIETYGTNVMGTVHLLEAMRRSHVSSARPCAVVIVTTDKCYENREWPWGYRENEPMGGFDPYSSSKGCAELVTAAFRRSFFTARDFSRPRDFSGHGGIAVASARAGNVIGGGDWSEDRLIPDMVRAFLKREPVVIRNPGSTRPWQHVMEPLSGYMRLAECLLSSSGSRDAKYAEAFNFGPSDDDCWPVGQVVENFSRTWGSGAVWHLDPTPQPHEAGFLKLDSSKAKAVLEWSPRWRLETALEATAAWYRRVLVEKAGARELCLEQIDSYTRYMRR